MSKVIDKLLDTTLNVNWPSHDGDANIGKLDIPLKLHDLLLHSLSFQARGTGGNNFGGGEVVGQVSLDSETTWHDVVDTNGSTICLADDGALRMIDPETANFTNIRLVMRGSSSTPTVKLDVVAWYGA